MDNLKNGLTLLQPTTVDAKLCNWYTLGSNIIIETIEQYLLRIPIKQRIPEVIVTILLPKPNYENITYYPVNSFKSELSNFYSRQYAFIGGVANENFSEISFNSTEISEVLIGDVDGVNTIFNTSRPYKQDSINIYVNGLKEFFFSKTGETEITLDFAPLNIEFTDKIEAIYKPK